ncbi:MAG TPA: zf-HC2 domain-containing protein [Candidatus Acidoferrum sp.]|nr:zf-HC2 domain-containing protein [Candidatus Acidoferrum sp.]
MRCRKVRSYLSAYCNDEVAGRSLVAIQEHLSTCGACRREESLYRSMREGARELRAGSLSRDFNARLLDRIAQERFQETRTRAYFPRPSVPVLSWRRVAPVLGSVAVIALAAIFALSPGSNRAVPTYASSSPGSSSLDDSYLTVQPDANPNMTSNLKKNWSLDTQLAKAERSRQISGMLTSSGGFASMDYREAFPWIYGYGIVDSPFGPVVVKIRPVLRIYETSGSTGAKEDQEVY